MQAPIPLFQLLTKDYALKHNVKPLHCKSLRHIQIIYYFEEYDVYNLIPFGTSVSICGKGTHRNRIPVHDIDMTNGLYTSIYQWYGLSLYGIPKLYGL